jgi:ferredoxin
MSFQGVVLGVGVVLVMGTLGAAGVAKGEGESMAAGRLIWIAAFLAILFGISGLAEGTGASFLGWVLLAGVAVGGGLFLVPFRGQRITLGTPAPGLDERDIMFSRAALEPGTERFREYYSAHPEFRTKDDLFRMEAGLMSPQATMYHPWGFAAADAAFWTIEMLRPFVEGSGGGGVGGAGISDEKAPAPSPQSYDPEAMSRFLKAWTLKLGAHSVGITELRDYHKYTHVGRGPGYGEEVRLDHPFALALTVEMDKEMVDRAPKSPTVMESARQYMNVGVMAVHLADLISRLGFRARAHVDGNYRVICPLVAKDAGLGELGRMGLLMTPGLGPRVRIAVVTTDLPLSTDAPFQDSTTLDFCLHCKKCSESCPSRALSFEDPEEDQDGVLRWKIDAEACFTLWSKMGTDCARCMAVCPYSHPENLMHNGIRWGIRNNALFRRGAIWMDDLVYGRKPPPRELQPWLASLEQPKGPSRSGSGGDM